MADKTNDDTGNQVRTRKPRKRKPREKRPTPPNFIERFTSDETNWRSTRYGYSPLGAAFARALMSEQRHNEPITQLIERFKLSSNTMQLYGTNTGNPTINSMEEIAHQAGMTILEFIGFTRDEIRAAYRRIGLDFDQELAKAKRVNEHPDHLAFKRRGPRFDKIRERRPHLYVTPEAGKPDRKAVGTQQTPEPPDEPETPPRKP